MSQNLLKISEILKNDYKPALENQIGIEPSPFLEKVKKVPLAANTIKAAAPIGINGGFGFGYEGTNTPTAGAQNYAAFTLDAVDMYVDIRISDKTVKLAGANAGAMVNALDGEVKGSYASAKWNIGRALFGDGTGKLAAITQIGADNVLSLTSTKSVIEGLVIDIYVGDGASAAYTARRITRVDRAAKTITVDGEALTAVEAADQVGFITVQNSLGREICGLGAIFDASIDSLYGLKKADNPWINPLAIDAGHDFTDIVIHSGVKQAFDYKNSQIDLIMMGDTAFSSYQTYMKENNVVVSDKHQFVGGAVGYKVLVGNREVVIVNERFVPDNEAWGVDTTAFSFESTGWDFASQDSGIFTLIPGTSVYRALLASYGNLMCANPGGCVRFYNCDLSKS
ncbi:MAG: phage major capsid protein [Clostridiales bacterium]|nr:phage major capsid protein [Clostridiales bacterium]